MNGYIIFTIYLLLMPVACAFFKALKNKGIYDFGIGAGLVWPACICLMIIYQLFVILVTAIIAVYRKFVEWFEKIV